LVFHLISRIQILIEYTAMSDKATMKGLVYLGPGEKVWADRPHPTILKPTDAIVRIHKTTICGTDLHIMRGSVKTVSKGRILGHEGIGVVTAVGDHVTTKKVGDKVLITCITSCGKCRRCKKGHYGQCEDGGWVLGNTIDGCQAEFVRIPHADHSLYLLPQGCDEDAMVMLSDILPTGLEVGVQDGELEVGQTVAIVGSGPVGLAAMIAVLSYSPTMLIMIDRDVHRLQIAKERGATHVIDNSEGQAVDEVLKLTQQHGVDLVIEAIGLPVGWEISERIVAAGGNIAILGVHGHPVTLHLESMWYKNFKMTAGLVHTSTIPKLMDGVMAGRVPARGLISHYFKMSNMLEAYETFTFADKYKSLKVIIENDLSTK